MDITVEELKTRMDNGEQINLIDVREPHEYEEFNLGGKLIPLGTLTTAMDELSDIKNDEIIIHCRSGARSGMAKMMLMENGFTHVRNLLGGVLDWQAKYGA
jgi:rhodanese-related sulfurtransferase